jgi:hypothetical protein
MSLTFSSIEWFDDSPHEGTPECVCSWCRQMIGTPQEEWPEDEDWEGPELAVRMWKGKGEGCKEARFHDRCLRDILSRGILKLN